ncbi:hypothetical protein ACFL5O_04375 [Myxococcota bacterium]
MRLRFLGLGLVLVSCGGMEPCNGVKVGDRILITIQGLAPRARDECDAELGLAAGQQPVATVEDLGGDHACLSGMGAFEEVNGWEWQRASGRTYVGGMYMLEGDYAVKRDDCSAKGEILLSSESTLSRTPTTAMLTVEYWPQGDPTGCPMFCSTDLDVEVQRL